VLTSLREPIFASRSACLGFLVAMTLIFSYPPLGKKYCLNTGNDKQGAGV